MLTFKIFIYPHTLMRGKSPSTTLTGVFWIDFPSHPCSIFFQSSQFTFIIFLKQDNRTRGKAQRPSAHSVNLTLSENHPVHPCAPAKGSAHAYTQNCVCIHIESPEDAHARAQQRTHLYKYFLTCLNNDSEPH